MAQGPWFPCPEGAGIPQTPATKAAGALPAIHPSAQKWSCPSRTSAHLAQYLPSNNEQRQTPEKYPPCYKSQQPIGQSQENKTWDLRILYP